MQVASGIDIPADIAGRLQQAVIERAAAHTGGMRPAAMKITITQFNVASVAARFFGGALAGSNKLYVCVEVVGSDGATLGRFEVAREANPGGYGIYFDQTQSTINDTAKGVMDGLYGAKPN